MTSDDTIVPLLGAGNKKWKASVDIVYGPKDGRVLGTKKVGLQEDCCSSFLSQLHVEFTVLISMLSQ